MDAVAFASVFLDEGKPLAAICHGEQLLIETGMINGKRLTLFHLYKPTSEILVPIGLMKKLWLITGWLPVAPDDLEAFNRKAIEEIGEGGIMLS